MTTHRRLVLTVLCFHLGMAVLPMAARATFQEPLVVGGRVLGPGGEPVAGARVELIVHGPPSHHLAVSHGAAAYPGTFTATDDHGLFRAEVPEAGLWRVAVDAPGYLPAAHPPLPLVEPTELSPVQLAPAAELRVRVTGPRGSPLAGALVRARPAREKLAGLGGLETGPWATAEQSILTDEQGLANLAADGPMLLTVSATGFPNLQREVDGGSRATTEIRLRSGRERTVGVRGVAGEAAAEVAIFANDLRLGKTTSPEGRANLLLPAAGEVYLRLLAADGRWAAGTLPAGGSEEGEDPTIFHLQPPLTITGQVVDRATREGVTGALVWAAETWAAPVFADGRGVYTLNVPFPEAHRSGTLRFGAAAAGHLSATGTPGPDPRQGPALALAPAVRVSGLVTGPDGRPLPGVEIQATPAYLVPPRAQASSWARSDARGAFHLTALDPHETWWLRVSTDDYVPARRTLGGLHRDEMPEPLHIVLEQGRDVVGRVLDSAGLPVSGARVRSLPSTFAGDPEGLLTARESLSESITADDGSFELPLLAPGRIDLHVEAAGYATTWVAGLELAPGAEPHDLGMLVLEPAVTLEGRVTDPQSRPVEGASVTLVSSGAGAVWKLPTAGETLPPEAVTGADGDFRVDGLREGEAVRLSVLRHGYVSRSLEVTVAAGESVSVELRPAVWISGRVTDEDGEPVSGAQLLVGEVEAGLQSPGGGRERLLGGGRSDANGEFLLADLEPGRLRLVVVASGLLPAELTAIDLAPGESLEELEITLESGAAIEGLVLDPDGAPVPGAHVRLGGDEAGRRLVALARPETFTDGEGRYRLAGIAEGRSSVEAEHPDFLHLRREIQVRPGGNRLDLRLSAGFEVSGSVTDPGGNPVAGVSVVLPPAGAPRGPQPVTTGASGTFRFAAVAPGAYRLVAEKAGYAPTRRPEMLHVAEGPVTGIELRLSRGGSIRGQIHGLAPEELSHVQVWASAPGLPGRLGRVGPSGLYLLTGLGPAEWTVRAHFSRGSREAGGLAVLEHDGEEVSLDIEFTAGFTLTGVVEHSGRPLDGVVISSRGPDGRAAGARTTETGRFVLAGLLPGPHEILILDPRRGLRQSERLQLDGDLDIRFQLVGETSAPAEPGNE